MKGTKSELRRKRTRREKARVSQSIQIGGKDKFQLSGAHSLSGIEARSSSTARRHLAAVPVQLYNVTNGFYGEFLGELHKGTYEVLITVGFERCRQQLPWWRDYQVDGAVPTRSVIE